MTYMTLVQSNEAEHVNETKPMQGSLPSSLKVCEILASLRTWICFAQNWLFRNGANQWLSSLYEQDSDIGFYASQGMLVYRGLLSSIFSQQMWRVIWNLILGRLLSVTGAFFVFQQTIYIGSASSLLHDMQQVNNWCDIFLQPQTTIF